MTAEQTLRVTLVQAQTAWHDPAANRRALDRLLAPLAGQTDLIALPEMFTTGFTMAVDEVAEQANGPSVDWMRATAARLNAVITGTIATRDGGKCVNRLIWMRPDGSHVVYDKRHLFRMGHEDQHYAAGTRKLIADLKGWKICPLICYDLRFPVWSRNRIGRAEGYDLLLYVASWPARRRHVWQTLLVARAIENQCYCIGVNRVGKDGNDMDHAGDSTAIDFLGEPLLAASEAELVSTVTLDKAALDAFRAKFPAHMDADDFDLRA